MITKSKKEISHDELDKNQDKNSGRYTPLGSKTKIKMMMGSDPTDFKEMPAVLRDKVIYPINECPHCASKATFHRRIQESGDIAGNVWRVENFAGEKGYAYAKFDYCLDCHKEFLIELYIWEFENK